MILSLFVTEDKEPDNEFSKELFYDKDSNMDESSLPASESTSYSQSGDHKGLEHLSNTSRKSIEIKKDDEITMDGATKSNAEQKIFSSDESNNAEKIEKESDEIDNKDDGAKQNGDDKNDENDGDNASDEEDGGDNEEEGGDNEEKDEFENEDFEEEENEELQEWNQHIQGEKER